MKLRILFAVSVLLLAASTYANLQVFPTKIKLSTRSKVSTVTIRNKGTFKTTYKLSAVFYKQSFDGQMKRIDDPGVGSHSIIKFLRFSPRRVTLAPNEEQVVRFMVRKTSKLSPGDYRAHIRFEPIKKEEEKSGGRDNLVMMKIDARVAINVPIIYSHGNSSGKISLEQFAISSNKEGSFFHVIMKKDESIFPFGTFKIFRLDGGKEEFISVVNGVSSYIPERRFTFKIEDFKKKRGNYEIRFFENEFAKTPSAKDQFKF
ncbi:hypothetical protein [Halobacteriovorax sp. JY17]|uniref:hypothetical protein n=1 Tax=Halobacteriovorax sp. JY17 TaxID=2014617 RepID=UPI000C40FBCF|nr:hypothetical protein [Halobacteriovorax sp. JY17]PIK16273.1 MAG: hypothetical protein CES88_05920 [Halobacteriovorax sp. JY17]